MEEIRINKFIASCGVCSRRNADAIVLATPTVNTRLYNYAYNSGKPLLPYGKPIASLDENKDGEKGKEGKEESQRLMDFLNSLINQE